MKKLSIITTVYKKGNIALTQIKRLVKFVEKKKINSEIIVVIDGIVSNEKQLISNAISKNNWSNKVKLFSYLVNRGKGFAQKFGFNKSCGDIVMFVDADTDIRMKSLDIALDTFLKNESKIDVVYPSKYHKDSDLDGTNNFRKMLSFGLKSLTFLILGKNSNIDDVSCGLKIFKKNTFKLFVNELFVNRFATDSEVYFWVNKLELKVMKVPFFMNSPQYSTSTNIFEIFKVFTDLILLGIQLKLRNSIRVEDRISYLHQPNPIV